MALLEELTEINNSRKLVYAHKAYTDSLENRVLCEEAEKKKLISSYNMLINYICDTIIKSIEVGLFHCTLFKAVYSIDNSHQWAITHSSTRFSNSIQYGTLFKGLLRDELVATAIKDFLVSNGYAYSNFENEFTISWDKTEK